jgi:hypothetical protein
MYVGRTMQEQRIAVCREARQQALASYENVDTTKKVSKKTSQNVKVILISIPKERGFN